MVFRARSRGAWLLAILVALPTTMVAQPTPAAATTKPVVQNASTTTTHRSSRRHRARKPPPGGVYARNAVVMDPSTGEILYEKNGTASVPIASLTKLMTAMVFLEGSPDLERSVAVSYDEIRGAGRTRLRNREIVELGDLLHMSLMCSDNCATRVIVRESGFTMDEFLARMNRKAGDLGLAQTKFVEVTGLDEHNVSSATDCARLLRAAAEVPTIHAISTTPTYEFRSATRPHTVVNTNRLLVYHRYEVLGGKTGFINEAGYCFATWVRTQGRDLIAVVLGAPTAATRFADVVRLVQKTTAPAVSSTN
jgi:serine-type D-Ala-D-Ala endopeptidase (penicillin-binding protein 7)